MIKVILQILGLIFCGASILVILLGILSRDDPRYYVTGAVVGMIGATFFIMAALTGKK